MEYGHDSDDRHHHAGDQLVDAESQSYDPESRFHFDRAHGCGAASKFDHEQTEFHAFEAAIAANVSCWKCHGHPARPSADGWPGGPWYISVGGKFLAA